MAEPCPDCLMYEGKIRALEARIRDLQSDRKEARQERDAAVAAFHDATRLRIGIQAARIKAEDERDMLRAMLPSMEERADLRYLVDLNVEDAPSKHWLTRLELSLSARTEDGPEVPSTCGYCGDHSGPCKPPGCDMEDGPETCKDGCDACSGCSRTILVNGVPYVCNACNGTGKASR